MVVGVSLIVIGAVAWAIKAREDPLASAPELKVGVFDYMVLPTLGESYRAGDVDVVLFAIAQLEEGGWVLHFVLHSDDGLDRHRTRLIPRGGDHATATCSASGRSGWGECYVEIPPALGSAIEFELWQDGIVEGGFHLDFSRLV